MDSFNWSKYQNNQELEESGLIMAASNSFNPIQQIQKSSTDSFPNLFPQWNSRSGNWGAAINAGLILQSSSSSFEYNRPCSTLLSQDTQNGLILEPGIPRNATGFSTNTNTNMSLESLDCLLQSGSNSQTDTTSVEDDGISLIFSDCKSLWNFTNVKPVVTPSADNCKNSQTVSRASADHDQNKIIKINQISRFSGDDDDDDNHEPNPTKRKRSESQQKQQNLDFHQSKNSATTDHQSLKHKKPRLDKHQNSSSNINFQQPSSSASSSADEPDPEAVAQMKEIIYRAAAFRPVDFGLEPVEKPKRKNVRISNDPQTVAARQRRERISERIRVLQRLVPGGSKMDTASMLDEAASYLKFLRSQVKALEAFGHKFDHHNHTLIDNFPPNANLGFSPFVNYSFTMQQPQFSFQNPNPVNQFKS